MRKDLLIVLLGLLTTSSLLAAPCSQIDKNHKDSDGMPLCPAIVETNSAYSVFRCALEQANKFHAPTISEKETMQALLLAFKQSTINGVSSATTQAILDSASKLGLQACRVKKTLEDGAIDSHILVYTKPGVRDYSGPLLMLRETKASKVIIVGPHDDTDGTFASTKIGFAKSKALACISNGHKRGRVGPRRGDFVHETDNLGTFAVAQFAKLFPRSIVLHFHGMKMTDKVLYRSRTDKLGKAFEQGIVKHTRIKEGAFKTFNADFTIDKLVNTDFYLKTEIPAAIHRENHMVIANVVKEIEKQSWAWSTNE